MKISVFASAINLEMKPERRWVFVQKVLNFPVFHAENWLFSFCRIRRGIMLPYYFVKFYEPYGGHLSMNDDCESHEFITSKDFVTVMIIFH